METQRTNKFLFQMIGFLLVAAITACNPVSPTDVDQPFEMTVTIEEPVMTATQEPTRTPLIPTIILVVADDTDQFTISKIQTTLVELSEQNGLILVEEESLHPEMLTENVRLVVGIGSGWNLNSLAQQAPNITFVAIDDLEVVPAENLFVIGDPSVRQEKQVFMAGYLAAVISSDYKVGGLFSTESGEDIVNAFVIGAEFFCGICKPSYPPYNDFPYWDYLSPESSNSDFKTVVDGLVNYGVEILFLEGDLLSPDILSYLANSEIKVISNSPPDIQRNLWVATVVSDPAMALAEHWQEILSGSNGVKLPSPITLVDTDAGWVSEGRMRLFVEMVSDLDAGLISPQFEP